MIVEKTIVKEGLEEMHNIAVVQLEELEAKMNEKIETNEEIVEAKETINRVTNEILEEFADRKTDLEDIVELTTKTIQEEVPDEEDVDADTEETEEA